MDFDNMNFDHDARILTYPEGINALMLSVVEKLYSDSGREMLDELEHKKALVELYYLHPDHMWSYNEYVDKVNEIITMRVLDRLREKGYVTMIMRNGERTIYVTDEAIVAYNENKLDPQERDIVEFVLYEGDGLNDNDVIEEIDE